MVYHVLWSYARPVYGFFLLKSYTAWVVYAPPFIIICAFSHQTTRPFLLYVVCEFFLQGSVFLEERLTSPRPFCVALFLMFVILYVILRIVCRGLTSLPSFYIHTRLVSFQVQVSTRPHSKPK